MSKKPAAKKKRRPKRKKRGRVAARRGRVVLAAAACLMALVLVGSLALYVSVTHRFDGRLWRIPSQVYSDTLLLTPGANISRADLIARLERSGYARTTGPPKRPGQYRHRDTRLEIHARAFSAPSVKSPARRLVLEFEGDRVASVARPQGDRLAEARLEPELLATLFGPRQEERDLVRLDEIPQRFVDAVLAAEDARFFSHRGVDPRGILRAAWANLRHGRIVQGGSTITQQTVKNLFLGQERTWWRKAREALTSVMLDARYSKDRILEVYLNEVYLGQRGAVAICGAQAAARFYFGHDLADLSLGESAAIAGLIRSPGRYNPFVHADRLLERREQVLQAMLRLGMIQAADVQRAAGEELALASGRGGYSGAAYAVDFVRSRLAARSSAAVASRDGLRIYTTLDTTWQHRAEAALESGLERLERDAPQVRRQLEQRRLQGAVLVTDPVTGAVLAMVGGRDYAQSQFNRAVQARRQPGSCFKPFVYATGFDLAVQGRPSGLTPRSVLRDSPIEMVSGGEVWRPRNYDGEFRGRVTVRVALEDSLNVPTVRAAQQVGLERIIESAHKAGIESDLPALPSLALGAGEITPLELAVAYGTLANGGMRRSAWIIREVLDPAGKPLALERPGSGRAISAEAASMITDVLQGVLKRGTARSAAALGYRGDAAGKTGTTDDTRDAWFVGYTADRLALAWVGYDENSRTGLTGASGALPIWVDVMRHAGGADDPESRRGAAGMLRVDVCAESGALAVKKCPHPVKEDFVAGTEPIDPCPIHQGKFKRWFRRLMGKDGGGVG